MGSDVLGRPCMECAMEKTNPDLLKFFSRAVVMGSERAPRPSRTVPEIIAALRGAMENSDHPLYGTEAERSAARSGVRDVAVRLGLYDLL